jgi:hypothetical protein
MLHYDYCHEESQVGGKSGENGFGFSTRINVAEEQPLV